MSRSLKLTNPFRLKRSKPKKVHGFLVEEDYGTQKHREKITKYFDKLEGKA